MRDIPEQGDLISLVSGYGKALYGLATVLALGASFMILIIYASFLSWAASGFIYYLELALSLLSVVGLLVGACFFWSSKKIFAQIAMFSGVTSATLGFWVFASTVSRDQGKANTPQLMVGLVLPTIFVFLGALASYFKLGQLKLVLR